MAYIKNQDLRLSHIDALVVLCGFADITSQVESNFVKAVQTENGERVCFTDLASARDYLVHQLVIRRTMAQLTNII